MTMHHARMVAFVLFCLARKGKAVQTMTLVSQKVTNSIDSDLAQNSTRLQRSCSTSQSYPAVGCESLYSVSGCTTSGIFWIRPDSNQAAFQVYCDMTDPNGDGGGWTLVFGSTSDTYRSFLTGCNYSANMLSPDTADGCASNMALTLGRAKYIKWTDATVSHTPFVLAEFQDIGAYYRRVFEQDGSTATVRYPKGPYNAWGWVPIYPLHHEFIMWGNYIGGHKCWWDENGKDRPFYNHNGGSNEEEKCTGYNPPYQYPSTAKRGGSFNYLIWVMEEEGAVPLPSPAASGGASAVGDPHLQNIHGERFDLMQAGKHVLINIPRGTGADHALLRVQADARRLGGTCADMYFQEINVTGSWAEAKTAGGYHYSVSQHNAKFSEWVAFGQVELKVVQGHTNKGQHYINMYVKHLGRAGFAVGGLLGEDDHADVSTPPQECRKMLALARKAARGFE